MRRRIDMNRILYTTYLNGSGNSQTDSQIYPRIITPFVQDYLFRSHLAYEELRLKESSDHEKFLLKNLKSEEKEAEELLLKLLTY